MDETEVSVVAAVVGDVAEVVLAVVVVVAVADGLQLLAWNSCAFLPATMVGATLPMVVDWDESDRHRGTDRKQHSSCAFLRHDLERDPAVVVVAGELEEHSDEDHSVYAAWCNPEEEHSLAWVDLGKDAVLPWRAGRQTNEADVVAARHFRWADADSCFSASSKPDVLLLHLKTVD